MKSSIINLSPHSMGMENWIFNFLLNRRLGMNSIETRNITSRVRHKSLAKPKIHLILQKTCKVTEALLLLLLCKWKRTRCSVIPKYTFGAITSDACNLSSGIFYIYFTTPVWILSYCGFTITEPENCQEEIPHDVLRFSWPNFFLPFWSKVLPMTFTFHLIMYQITHNSFCSPFQDISFPSRRIVEVQCKRCTKNIKLPKGSTF